MNGAFGENFPYTNFHDLNLDWIIRMIKEMDIKLDKAIEGKITVADPIQWSIIQQYEEFEVVMDHGNAYLSIQPGPSGIEIANTLYWQKIFDLSQIFTCLKRATSFSDDESSAVSSQNRSVNDLVWLNNILLYTCCCC